MTAETWSAWFDRFKAEKALEKAKALSNTDFKQKLRQVSPSTPGLGASVSVSVRMRCRPNMTCYEIPAPVCSVSRLSTRCGLCVD